MNQRVDQISKNCTLKRKFEQRSVMPRKRVAIAAEDEGGGGSDASMVDATDTGNVTQTDGDGPGRSTRPTRPSRRAQGNMDTHDTSLQVVVTMMQRQNQVIENMIQKQNHDMETMIQKQNQAVELLSERLRTQDEQRQKEINDLKAMVLELQSALKQATQTPLAVPSYASLLESGTSTPRSSPQSSSSGKPLKSVRFGSSAATPSNSEASLYRRAIEQLAELTLVVGERTDTSNINQLRERITTSIKAIEGIEDINIDRFRMLDRGESKAIRFLIPKGREAAVQQREESWVPTGLRLVAPKWIELKVHYIEKSQAVKPGEVSISTSAKERFSTENGVQVMTMAWLKRPRDDARFGSAKIKVATEADAIKLLEMRDPAFGGQSTEIELMHPERTPKVCYKCNGYGHIAKDCTHMIRCSYCSAEHDRKECNATSPKCANCGEAHRAHHKDCVKYKAEKARLNNLSINDQVA